MGGREDKRKVNQGNTCSNPIFVYLNKKYIIIFRHIYNMEGKSSIQSETFLTHF